MTVNPRPAAAAVIRAAQTFLSAASRDVEETTRAGRQLDAVIGRQLLGVPRAERRRFIATLALAAADFALELPDAQRALIFAKLDATDDELAGVAAGILLTDPTGGIRTPTDPSPVADDGGSPFSTDAWWSTDEARASDVPEPRSAS